MCNGIYKQASVKTIRVNHHKSILDSNDCSACKCVGKTITYIFVHDKTQTVFAETICKTNQDFEYELKDRIECRHNIQIDEVTKVAKLHNKLHYLVKIV